MRATVVGAGLAGCEAAYFLAERGFEVTLFEQKPTRRSAAHTSDGFAELVCSNSLKSAAVNSAAGLLKAELRLLDSMLLPVADECRVPAGGALAVDRAEFSKRATEKILSHPNIAVKREEFSKIDENELTIIATGPLTDGALAEGIAALCGEQYLSFYDAASPIVLASSLDRTQLFEGTRFNKGDADYLNSFMDRAEFEAFERELMNAERAAAHDGGVYESCMPIETLAARGKNAIRFGPLKPVGLHDPRTGRGAYAVVQLRREDVKGSMYNLVGFQTSLRFSEQRRVFRMIKGLEKAEFVRYGVMHRNTFINSPRLLSPTLRLEGHDNILFAGQITGVEGYMESAMCGLMAARFAAGVKELPSANTMCGALLRYITAKNENFQPMGANMGLLPSLGCEINDKKKRYQALADRAINDMEEYIHENNC